MFEWILHVIEVGGYGGIFTLMVLENVFPPIPSEVILPLAGYSVATDGMSLLSVIMVATLGTVVGTMPWYIAGRVFGARRLKALSVRYGRWLTLSPSDIEAAEAWFQTHGKRAVLFGRLIPTVRTLISVPAGIAHLPLPTFLLYSFVGSLLWTSLLTYLGFILGNQHERVAEYLNPVSDLVILVIVAVYLYRVVTFKVK
jgi:membrane protein DedA with SNARE-associated domain